MFKQPSGTPEVKIWLADFRGLSTTTFLLLGFCDVSEAEEGFRIELSPNALILLGRKHTYLVHPHYIQSWLKAAVPHAAYKSRGTNPVFMKRAYRFHRPKGNRRRCFQWLYRPHETFFASRFIGKENFRMMLIIITPQHELDRVKHQLSEGEQLISCRTFCSDLVPDLDEKVHWLFLP